ncbi:hypothetical protein GCM10022415_31890 [Knoellia locipacati]|uniref:Glycosyltransferase subfamily 4-like N-terminal domain-containing protein n=1 Tax=Knoellia locipacati TaxID=882824 RepID=A0A512T3N0_9MICO|nr:glycosyltransferase family 4 protein [Knoellia locipacati]GEQ14807.1 hypothetical protein KLO01_28540 [Knoellia locipacati]
MSRLTVLHVVPQDSWRGAQVYAGRLRDTLARDDTQRHVAVALFDAPAAGLRPDLVASGRPGVARRLGLDPVAAQRLHTLVRHERADVVVAHGGESMKYAVLASGRVPVVYYKIGLSTAELARPWRRRLYRALARRTAMGVAVSTAVRDQMRDVLGMPADRLRVVPNARDPETYHPDAGAAGADSVAEDAAGPPRVLFVGQLEPGKRPELFLDVVARLRHDGVEFTPVIIGDGELRSVVGPRAEQLGVSMLGVRDDVPDWLRDAAVLVMTSAADTEGMPGVCIEAGLTGVPVVTTSSAGAADVVVDGVTGHVVADDSVTELAARTANLLRDPDLRRIMGVRARAHCIDTYSIAAGAAQWRQVAADVLEPARQVGPTSLTTHPSTQRTP